MAKVWISPTGRLTKGHVLDVGLTGFREALRAYDRDLYVFWNPSKLRGWGCWEIRRKSEALGIVDTATYNGSTFVHLERTENDIVNHVLDCAFLNYDQIRKIKEMDTWAQGITKFGAHIDAKEQEARQAIEEKSRKEVRYAAQHYKKEIEQYKDFVLSGNNPHLALMDWESVKEA